MLSSNRRAVLFGASALVLSACGFVPAYGPGGALQPLRGKMALDPPKNKNDFDFNARLDERLGRAPQDAPYILRYTISTSKVAIGLSEIISTNRFHLIGTLTWRLVARADKKKRTVARGKVERFVAYTIVSESVAEVAAQEDAAFRLTHLLADQFILDLMAQSDVLQ